MDRSDRLSHSREPQPVNLQFSTVPPYCSRVLMDVINHVSSLSCEEKISLGAGTEDRELVWKKDVMSVVWERYMG